MFTHVACFRWVDGTRPEQVETAVAALNRLPSLIPEIRDYLCGPDAGISEGNYDFAVVSTFDNRDGYMLYADHPEHQRVIAEFIRPHVAVRVAVQFES